MPQNRQKEVLAAMWLVKNLVLGGIIFFLQNTNPAFPAKPPHTAEGQTLPSAAEKSGAALPVRAIEPSLPVITIPGLCNESAGSGPGKQSGACSTVITRSDFEKLMDALNPEGQPVSQNGRQNLAQAYVEALAFAD